MKKLLFSTVLAAFIFTTLNAQDINFGVKAGINFANVSGNFVENFDQDSRTSIHIGGVAEFILNDKFSVQPELLYSGQGFTGYDNDFESNDKYKLDYLIIPIMAKYYVAEGFSIEAGPQIGFLLSAKGEFDYDDGFSEKEDLKDYFKGFDFGLNIGAGYKLNNGLNFAARYSLGLSNILDTSNEDIEDNASLKNGVFQLSVGYMF